MGCSGRYATAQEYEDLLCAGLDLTDVDVKLMVENALDLAASDVHAALASIGACDCTLAGWATEYLKKLNIIDAAVLQNCPCGNFLNDEKKRMFQEWLNQQYDLIRKGEIVVCAGETGTHYPAVAIAQFGITDWNKAGIIVNDSLKETS